MAGKVLKSSLNKKSQMISNYSYKRYKMYHYYYYIVILQLHLSWFVWLAASKLPAGNIVIINKTATS